MSDIDRRLMIGRSSQYDDGCGRVWGRGARGKRVVSGRFGEKPRRALEFLAGIFARPPTAVASQCTRLDDTRLDDLGKTLQVWPSDKYC